MPSAEASPSHLLQCSQELCRAEGEAKTQRGPPRTPGLISVTVEEGGAPVSLSLVPAPGPCGQPWVPATQGRLCDQLWPGLAFCLGLLSVALGMEKPVRDTVCQGSSGY